MHCEELCLAADRAKIAAYLTLFRPCFEYCNVVWTLYTAKNIKIESVQHRAAKWIKSSFDPFTFQWSKSSDVCLRELGWPSLERRRNYACITMLYAILYKFTPIKFSDCFQLNTQITFFNNSMFKHFKLTLKPFLFLSSE